MSAGNLQVIMLITSPVELFQLDDAVCNIFRFVVMGVVSTTVNDRKWLNVGSSCSLSKTLNAVATNILVDGRFVILLLTLLEQ